MSSFIFNLFIRDLVWLYVYKRSGFYLQGKRNDTETRELDVKSTQAAGKEEIGQSEWLKA